MQTTFMTTHALRCAMRQSAALIRMQSKIRVAALAQPVAHAGFWNSVRFNWTDEPERIASFSPTRSLCSPQNGVYEVFEGDKKIGISVASCQATALENAIRATTRRTSSKLDTSCDYDNLSVRPFGK